MRRSASRLLSFALLCACAEPAPSTSERSAALEHIMHPWEVLISAPAGTVIQVRERDTDLLVGAAAAGSCNAAYGAYNWTANTQIDGGGGCVTITADRAYVFSVAGAANHLVYRFVADPCEGHDLYATYANGRFSINPPPGDGGGGPIDDAALPCVGHEAYLATKLATAVTPQGSGAVARSPSAIYHRQGSSVTLSATPSAPSWRFSSWSGGATGSSNPLTLDMSANRTVTAAFIPSPLSVSIGGPTCVGKSSGSHTWWANIIGGTGSYTYAWTSSMTNGVIGTWPTITLPFGPGFRLYLRVASGIEVAYAQLDVGVCSGCDPEPASDPSTDALPCLK